MYTTYKNKPDLITFRIFITLQLFYKSAGIVRTMGYDRYLCCMPHHEPKSCPRCNALFECKVGNVAECQCSGISFTENEKHYIAQQYSDCLCRKCLLDMRHEIRLKEFNAGKKRILN